jgi:uncharacterized protein YifN (PemK superfamily)
VLRIVNHNNWPSDEEIEKAGWVRLSRRERLIQSRARAGQYYWVDFPHDAYAPEFVGEHPGVVIRGGNALHSTSIIVPITSKPQAEARYVHKLSKNPSPKGQRDRIDVFAICDHLYTVNVCRLRPLFDLRGGKIYPYVADVDFKAIRDLVQKALFPPGPAVMQPQIVSNGQTTLPKRPIGPNTLTLPKRPKVEIPEEI